MRQSHSVLASFFVFLSCLLVFSSTSQAASAQEIQERMKTRYPVITNMKDSGIVGENNKGYLEFRAAKLQNKDIVDAENSDRKTVYQAIAQKQNTTADLVGSRRAIAIAENGKTGHLFQRENGTWYVK